MKSSFFNGPIASPPMRTSFRTARGFASGAIALCAVFFFLYAFKIYSIPSPNPQPLKDLVQPQSPLHSGLSDPPPSDAWTHTPWTPVSEADTPPHPGAEDAESAQQDSQLDDEVDGLEGDLHAFAPYTMSSSSTSAASISTSSSATPSPFEPASTSGVSASSSTLSTANATLGNSSSSALISVDTENSGISNKEPENAGDYTTTVVVGRTKSGAEGVEWIRDELKDITKSAIYIVDDPEAELHLNRNKGREAMVYMKYILEHYDKLSDVTVFFHSGRKAWHNNVMANKDGAVMINNLRRQHVMDEGYFNMRCELHPGCPQWIKWNASKAENDVHPERFADLFSVKTWDLLFPNRTHDPVYLSQPCCSQFALSREKIRSIPIEQYQRIHDFIAKSTVLDGFLGRIMEYVWQFLWLDKDEHCPSMTECYCKGFGLCFEGNDAQTFTEWNEAKGKEDDYLTELGKYDRENCATHEDEDEKKECKQHNPFNNKVGEQRTISSKLMADLKRYIMTQP